MCTVTVLPLAGGYLLATNRDESPHRGPALPPAPALIGGRQALFPRDSDAGGTWVAVDEAGHGLCLLNGDRSPAAPPPADPVSRGLLVLDLLARPGHDAVWRTLNERRDTGELAVRSFKLLVLEPGTPPGLVLWDGAELARERLPDAAVVVSSTWNSEEVHARRSQAFAALAEVPEPLRAERQRAWHSGHAPGVEGGDAYSICMHRDDANSVSFTQVVVEAERVQMAYQSGSPCLGGVVVAAELGRRPVPGPERQTP